MSRAPYDRFRQERSDTSILLGLSGVRRRDLISWLLLVVVIVGSMLIGTISPIVGVLLYLYAPEMLGIWGIFVASGAALITTVGTCRKLLLDILDRVEIES